MASKELCAFSALTLNSLRLEVHLGCSAQERAKPQTVRFDIHLRFQTLPLGCESDSLEETVCYQHLSNLVRSVCERQEYQLVERLGSDTYRAIRNDLPHSIQLWIRVTKEKPPIPNLEGGASFCLGDWSQI